MKTIYMPFVALLSIMLITSCGSNAKTDKTVKKESIESVSATDFISGYSSSKADYDKKYLDQAVTLSGPVANAVSVDNGFNIEIEGEDGLQTISCNFDKSALTEDKLPKEGDVIKVKGKCTGYQEETEMGLKTVTLVQCLIEE